MDPAVQEELERLRREAETFGLRVIEQVPDACLDPALVERLPVEWARAQVMLPVRLDGRVTVLTADPTRVRQLEDLALLIGEDPATALAPAGEILKGIERCYFRRDDSPDRFLEGLEPSGAAAPAVRAEDLLAGEQQAPVTRLINLILIEAVKRRASDIHFEPFEDRLRVRYRIDGILYEQSSPPKHLEDGLVSRLKVMAHMDIAERRLPQDGMARVRVGEREIDLRLSTVPVAEGERVVLRILDRDQAWRPLEDLGMPAGVRMPFEELLQAPHGMVAVCGPTGSGKTTTLYASLGRLDASRRNILTIEDPVEYRLPGIGQIQVKPKIGLTFANGLRHILRQDPDVVLVGETRDRETADIAVRAALTGHLVFTTLHTNDAAGAVTRLADMGVEPYLIASCLRGALAQRLVRRLCPACRRAAVLDPSRRRLLGEAAGLLADGDRVWEAAGCADCLEGYRGRSGVFELMRVDRALAEAIRLHGQDTGLLRRLAVEGGMRGLVEDALDRLRAGETSLDEVLNVAAA